MDTYIQQTRDAVLNGLQIDHKTARQLLDNPDKEGLHAAADAIRLHFMGNRFHLCSIINAKSGNCSEDCRFCAQSARHHTGVDTYSVISEEEALEIAQDNDIHGVDRLSLVTSGRKLSEDTTAELAELYKLIESAATMHFCASAGLLDAVTAQRLVEAGVSRYHCNLEANKDFFPKVCTTHTWEQKVDTLDIARKAGMTLCSGGILGMGEAAEDRLALAFELRQLAVKSIPINILTPIEGTPLGELVPLSSEEVLTAIALFRFINPDAVIRIAGGRQQLGDDQYKCFQSGANGAIVGNYLTTTGSTIADDIKTLSTMGFTFARR